MAAAKSTNKRIGAGRALSPDSKGVFVPRTPDQIAELDADRAVLGVSRGRMMGEVYDNFKASATTAAQQRAAAADLQAAVIERLAGPLVDALQDLTTAITERANQRRAIGVNVNQVAKLANALRIAVDRGDLTAATGRQLDAMVLSLQGIEQLLAQQAQAELGDDKLAAQVRRALDPPGLADEADAA